MENGKTTPFPIADGDRENIVLTNEKFTPLAAGSDRERDDGSTKKKKKVNETIAGMLVGQQLQ